MDLITIYVVDDYLLNRIAYKRYFKNDSNFEVLGDFSCALDCINQMEQQCADVVLMDIDLPDMNGIEVTKIIKERFPKTKVIMLSSYKDEEKILASLVCGACSYVLKNSKNVNLKKVIQMAVKGEFWMDLEIAKMAFSIIPLPDTRNLENLYQNRKMKDSLTERELEVLKLLIKGKTNSQIAREIIVSTNTAKAHVGNILTKLSVKDRVQAAVKAVRAGIF